MRKLIIVVVAVSLLAGIWTLSVERRSGKKDVSGYAFDGSMPEEVLHRYLSRSVQIMDLFWFNLDPGKKREWLRFIENTGAKLIGRAAMIWANFEDDETMFANAGQMAEAVHAQDPEIILQAAIFETTAESVNDIPIPAWVFEEYGLPPEKRNFNYEAMLYPDGRYLDNWGAGKSVPDITSPETQLFFFYRAKRFIDLGYESIHFGQVKLMGEEDSSYANWNRLLKRVRKYAAEHGRRHNVLLDAHVNEVYDDSLGNSSSDSNPPVKRLSFDFVGYPARIKPLPRFPQETKLEMNYIDAIYGKTIGGISPQGWETSHTPYLIEMDNYGGTNGMPGTNQPFWPWGYDEIAWFAHQNDAYRRSWLAYAYDWIQANDPNGHIQMPAYRTLGNAPVGTNTEYNAIQSSDVFPASFGDEEAIKAIWGASDGSGVVEDELQDLTKTYRLSSRLDYDRSPAASYGGDRSRITTSESASGEYVIYKAPFASGQSQLTGFAVNAWLNKDEPEAKLMFYVSSDDENYSLYTPDNKPAAHAENQEVYSGSHLPEGTKYLKIRFPDHPGAAQIGKVTLNYENAED
ncbi:hypothetical protein [Paenibacillus mendelii]|uniref:Uncharacterized protein n=1 Tax=Paenibacillus mendelii TaxID=206163 RepID=A0ABV6J2P4_9BACL|nr:hypothetical protein [Paenibacillus mendelii]MCQ6559247.1 hypothetical protein [Paenibacillus mendelii]